MNTIISYCSDIHLEFSYIHLENSSNAQILILAGDICTANDSAAANTLAFFNNVCKQWQTVIYVPGNHEHYNSNFYQTLHILKSNLKYPNLHILSNQTLEINNIIFAATTLWTNCNNNDPITANYLNKHLNDFKKIFINEYSTLNTNTIVSTFNQNLIWLKNTVYLNKNKSICVITHHAPSKMSTHEKYKNNYLMNGAYSSELFEFIAANTNIKYWVHGHTHDEFDYTINQTRVLCNPRGYECKNYKEKEFILKHFNIETV